MLYVNAWFERSFDQNPTTFFNTYLLRKSEWNLGYINWQPYASCKVVTDIVPRINAIANATVVILNGNSNFDPTKTHLIGSGIGSLIASRIARTFSASGKTFDRLTALDPFNFFRTLDIVFKLRNVAKVSPSDASFVDVILTNADGLGDSLVKGHVNFWPAGGRLQPNCNATIRSAIDSIGKKRFLGYVRCPKSNNLNFI